MASEGERVDGDAAENLTSAAKEALDQPSQAASGTHGVDSAAKEIRPSASEFIQNVAHIVLDKSNQAADSSKTYVENVVHKVRDYAQNAAGSSSNVQERLSGSVTGTPDEAAASSPGSDDHGGLVTSVATWCSSLCGSKSGTYQEVSELGARICESQRRLLLKLCTPAAAAAPIHRGHPHNTLSLQPRHQMRRIRWVQCGTNLRNLLNKCSQR